MYSIDSVHLSEVDISAIAHPGELINQFLLDATVKSTNSSVVSSAVLESGVRTNTVILNGFDTIVDARLVWGIELLLHPLTKIVLRIHTRLGNLRAIAGSGYVWEMIVYVSMVIEWVYIIPMAFYSVVESDVHLTLCVCFGAHYM